MHDVLIAGAGPVGLTLALRLARHGIHATVLEALDTPERDLRASTFHPSTLDLLDVFAGLDLNRADAVLMSGPERLSLRFVDGRKR